eukprot:scaffold127658_cov35-Prasinocladus_malaysianus.AAC.1
MYVSVDLFNLWPGRAVPQAINVQMCVRDKHVSFAHHVVEYILLGGGMFSTPEGNYIVPLAFAQLASLSGLPPSSWRPLPGRGDRTS